MTAITTDGAVSPMRDLRAQMFAAARLLAMATLIGALSGLVVVGVLARLAMRLLAVMNTQAAGVTSDDGFTMGQFTLEGSLQLALAGVQLGVVGAGLYVAVRGLMIGPTWFRLLSISVGPAVVVGAILVHTDGVDFTLLDPPGLSIAMFVALPGLYVAMLHLLFERVVRSGRQPPLPMLVLGLLPWLPLLPLTLLLAVGSSRNGRHGAAQAGVHSSPTPGPVGSRGQHSRHYSSSPWWT